MFHSFRHWARRLFAPTKPIRRGFRPTVEGLEDRAVPAVYVITGIADGGSSSAGGNGSAANPFKFATLRGALDDINNNHADEKNTVKLTAGLTYDVTEGQLEIDVNVGGKVTVKAIGAGQATIEADQTDNGPFRVLEVFGDSEAVLRKLVITGGVQDSTGGGILNEGNLTLINSTVTGNIVFDDASKFAAGAGIASFGSLTLDNSTVTDNHVIDEENGSSPPLFAGFGGGIANSGFLELKNNSIVSDNTVLSKFAAGGGIAHIGATPALVSGESLVSPTLVEDPDLSISNSQVLGNTAEGVAVEAISKFEFTGITSIALGGGIFDVGTSSISISTSTVADNKAIGGNADDLDSKFAGIAAGGGLSSGLPFDIGPFSGSEIEISRSTFSNNQAIGGSSDFIGGGPAFGGGAFINSDALLITNSTFSGNVAQGGAGGGAQPTQSISGDLLPSLIVSNDGPGFGGGLAIGAFESPDLVGPESEKPIGPAQVLSSHQLINVTITQNQALSGISTLETPQLANGVQSLGYGGGIANLDETALALWNTIVAQNFIDLGEDENLEGSDVHGFFISTGTDSGHNLIGNADGSTGFGGLGSGDIVGTFDDLVDAVLGELAFNGGPTQTHALLEGSPAIDAGDDLVLGPPPNLKTDQRGLPRKSGAHVDIGAFEVQGGLRNRRWDR